jgi:IclR family transcriptional regulator, acetate operon repressor
MGSVQTTLNVLEFVSEHQPVGVSDVARGLELPKSSAQRALAALCEAGWIRKVDENVLARWVLTPRALIVGSQAGGEDGLTALARPAMEKLRSQTQETINLLVRDGDFMVIVERVESPHMLRSAYPLGMRAAMTSCSGGKAFLATLPYDQVVDILTHELPPPDQASMWEELEQTRERGFAMNDNARGFAVDDEGLAPDISAVAAVIFDARHLPVAAISVTVPSQRMTTERWDSYGLYAIEAADKVSAALGHKSLATR